MPNPVRKPQPGDPDFDWSTYSQAERDQPLNDAKGYLAQAPDLSGVANLDERLAGITKAKHGLPRQITDALETVVAGPTGLAGMVPTPLSPALLGTSAGIYGLAGLRKALMPEADESRIGGAIETGLSALPALGPISRLVRGASTVASVARPSMIDEVVNTAKGYMGKGMTRPQAGQMAGWPLGQSKEIPYRAGSGVSMPSASEQVAGLMDDVHVPPDYAAELARASAAKPTPNAKAVFDKMAGEGAFGPEQRAFSNPKAFTQHQGGTALADEAGLDLGPNAFSPESGASFGDAAGMNAANDGIFTKATRSGGRYGGAGDPYPLPSLKALAELARMR